MFEHGISAAWLKRAQWAIYIFFGLFALASLCYVFYSAAHRDVFQALLGAGVVWGSIGLGIGMHCITQMAAVVDSNLRALNELRKRADAMEQLIQQMTPLVNLSHSGVGDPSRLIAARLDRDAFPRIVHESMDDSANQNPERKLGATASNQNPERKLGASAALSDDCAIDVEDSDETLSVRLDEAPQYPPALRKAFRDAVFSGDLELALAIGEDIVELFPDSAMAAQFRDLREPLMRRAQQSERTMHSSVS